MGLTYDFQAMPELSAESWLAATQAFTAVQNSKANLGFSKLPYADISELKKLAQAVSSEVEAVIAIGIGGSDLGARAVHRALNHQFYNQLSEDRRHAPRLFFLGDTTDPEAIHEVLDVVDLTKTAVVIISKSGNTIEQMSTFVYVQSKIPEELRRQRIIVITDAEAGTLRALVTKEEYRSLPVPSDVGGRFSVLSTVALFVIALTGVKVDQLLEGARWMDEQAAKSVETDPVLRFATHQYQAATHGQPISVLMPYQYCLREVGFWYRQLWAESLGKRLDRLGAVVNVGSTPIAALGPTDQHSQLQLYCEGPKDKVLTFIGIEETSNDAELPAVYPDLEGISYLAGHHFGEILKAEMQSTAAALQDDGRPSSTITLTKLDAFHLGALLYFFELATAYSGELYGINAYDQPGVELSKDIMYGLLKRPGYFVYKPTLATPEQMIILK